MYNSKFWMVLTALVVFILGIIFGMLIDYITEKRAEQKALIIQTEVEIKRLKAKCSFYQTLLEEKDGRQDM